MKAGLLLFLTAGLLAPAAVRADGPRADVEALRGTWLVVSQQRAGRPAERPKDMRWVIDGDTIGMTFAKGPALGRGPRMTFRLDPTRVPMRIDLDGPKKSSSYGICKLEGDELTLCLGVTCPSPSFDPQARPNEDAERTRPAAFRPEAGTVIVLKRVKE
jgi:uncharacterized protein (TIGR03067 family)